MRDVKRNKYSYGVMVDGSICQNSNILYCYILSNILELTDYAGFNILFYMLIERENICLKTFLGMINSIDIDMNSCVNQAMHYLVFQLSLSNLRIGKNKGWCSFCFE